MGIKVYSLLWVMQDLYHQPQFSKLVPFRVLLMRVLYSIGDLKRGPNLENYPHHILRGLTGFGFRV